MKHIRGIVAVLVLGWIMIGCGGSNTIPSGDGTTLADPTGDTSQTLPGDDAASDGSTGDTSQTFGGGTTDSGSPLPAPLPDINLSAAIANNEITGYDTANTKAQNYLAVVNYIRSQSIQCVDTKGYKGPSNPLQWSDTLAQASQGFAEYKVINGYYGANNDPHKDLAGNEVGYRATTAGYDYSEVGENVGFINITYDQGVNLSGDEWLLAMEGWVKSTKGHCSNLMRSDFVDFGMGEAVLTTSDTNKTVFFVQMFGKPKTN